MKSKKKSKMERDLDYIAERLYVGMEVPKEHWPKDKTSGTACQIILNNIIAGKTKYKLN